MNEERNKAKLTIKPKTLLKFKAEQAVQLLEEHIATIPNVQGWAEEAGVSRRWLCKSMKEVYGKSPKIFLREMKYNKVVWLICKDGTNSNCYSVAVDAGFRNEIALSKFLKAFYGTNFTKLKVKIVNGKA